MTTVDNDRMLCFRKLLENKILVVNTVYTLILLGFIFTIVQLWSLTGKFAPARIVDWAHAKCGHL